jgi:flagellar biosynthesis protein FlhG
MGSGKGGVGTSTVSALLALSGARDGREVLLVDGDEGVGSLHLLLGLDDPGPGLGDLRGGELNPEDLLHRVAPTLWFLPGGGGGSEATLATSLGEKRALFRRAAGLYDDFDLVVLDGGSHLASVLAACLAGAERLTALTTRDRVSMAATHALLKVTRARFPTLALEVLVNREDAASSEEVYRTLHQASAHFLGIEPSYAGGVPEDNALRAGSREGLPLPHLEPGLPAPEAVAVLHARLAAQQIQTSSQAGPTPPISLYS